MTDRIDFGGKPWKAIPRAALRDARLSLKAKGALVTLLSHEEGWVRSCIAILMHDARCGRDAAKAAMAELRLAGYAELVREQDAAGRWSTCYVIHAEPVDSTAVLFGSPGDGKPDRRETRPPENPAVEVEPLEVEPLEVEPQDQRLAPAPRTRARDEVFETLCAIGGHGWNDLNAIERGRLNKARGLARESNATPAAIRQAAERWPDVMGDATMTALGVMSNFHRLLTGPGRQGRSTPGARSNALARKLGGSA